MSFGRGLSVAALCALVGACRAPAEGPYLAEQRPRETVRAEALAREGLEWLEKDKARAEELLRQALAADLFYGPAHNNLGVLHLERGELYEAAHEFEWARKLMPGNPDPRINLALVMEEAGRLEDARGAYEAALQVAPGSVAAMQGLALLAVRQGEHNAELEQWLERIALEGEDEEWREWARLRRGLPR